MESSLSLDEMIKVAEHVYKWDALPVASGTYNEYSSAYGWTKWVYQGIVSQIPGSRVQLSRTLIEKVLDSDKNTYGIIISSAEEHVVSRYSAECHVGDPVPKELERLRELYNRVAKQCDAKKKNDKRLEEEKQEQEEANRIRMFRNFLEGSAKEKAEDKK